MHWLSARIVAALLSVSLGLMIVATVDIQANVSQVLGANFESLNPPIHTAGVHELAQRLQQLDHSVQSPVNWVLNSGFTVASIPVLGEWLEEQLQTILTGLYHIEVALRKTNRGRLAYF